VGHFQSVYQNHLQKAFNLAHQVHIQIFININVRDKDHKLIYEAYVAEGQNDPYGSSRDEFTPGVDDEGHSYIKKGTLKHNLYVIQQGQVLMGMPGKPEIYTLEEVDKVRDINPEITATRVFMKDWPVEVSLHTPAARKEGGRIEERWHINIHEPESVVISTIGSSQTTGDYTLEDLVDFSKIKVKQKNIRKGLE